MNKYSFTWPQVHTWRLKQHGLFPRLQRKDFCDAITRACGLQAQVMSAGILGIWARTDGVTQEDIDKALWEDHSIIKMWAMRGTLHLLLTKDLPLYAPALTHAFQNRWKSYFDYWGFSEDEKGSYVDGIAAVLNDMPLTKEQLATALVQHTGIDKYHQLIVGANWGSPLKPSAHQGQLVFGQNIGQNVTFVNPRSWLNTWEEIGTDVALVELMRRFIHSYGPIHMKDFSRWLTEGNHTLTRYIFNLLKDELTEVDVEGEQRWILTSDLEDLKKTKLAHSVHLLPLFDVYTLILGVRSPIIPKEHYKKVFRPQGWISATVIIDGLIKGVWEYKTKNDGTLLTIKPFSKFTVTEKKEILAEAQRLGGFLKTTVKTIFE